MPSRGLPLAPGAPPIAPNMIAIPQRQQASHPIWLIMPALLLVYAAILPTEIRFNVLDQNIYLPRLVGFFMLPVVFFRVVRGSFTPHFCDVAVLAAAFWMITAFIVYYGPSEGLLRGAALALDTAIPYFIARTSFHSLSDIRRLLVLVAPVLFLAGLTMLIEIFADRHIVKSAFESIFGERAAYEGGLEVARVDRMGDRRLGVLRAKGPFPHPILAGLFIISFLPLYLNSGLRKWPFWVGTAAALFSIFSVSSAAFIGIFLNVGLLIVDRLHKTTTFVSWKAVIPASIGLLVAANMATTQGIIPFLTQFTLSPQTAYFRRLTWDYGMASVLENPWFGIGFQEIERLSWMPETVDNHWLLIAIRYGVFPALVLILVALYGVYALARASGRHTEMDRNLIVGMAISLFTFTLLGFSVAFFGGSKAWFYMMVGMAITCSAMHSLRPRTLGTVPLAPQQGMQHHYNTRQPAMKAGTYQSGLRK